MFKRDLNTMESYVHTCDCFNREYLKKLKENVIIGRHDVSNYMILVESKKMMHIRNCPFCGVDLDKDFTTSQEVSK